MPTTCINISLILNDNKTQQEKCLKVQKLHCNSQFVQPVVSADFALLFVFVVEPREFGKSW